MANNFKKYQPNVIDTSEVEARFKRTPFNNNVANLNNTQRANIQQPIYNYTQNNFSNDSQGSNIYESAFQVASQTKLLPDVITTEEEQEKDYQLGDTLKKIRATGRDVQTALQEGFLRGVEGIVDIGAGLVGGVGKLFGAETNNIQNFIEKDYTSDIMNSKAFGYMQNPLEQALSEKSLYAQAQEDSYLTGNKIGETYIRGSAQAIGQMLPSILIGGTGGAVAKGIGTAVFGLGAAGSSMQQALNEGANYEQALAYGAASGILETGIEMLSGGIGGLGKGIIDKTLAQSSGALVARLANNSAFKFGSAILGEGLEETLSTFADPYLKRFTYDPDALNATMPEYVESFILGAITSGVMNSVPALSKNTRINEEVQNINNIIDAQSEAQSKGRLNDVKVLADVVRTKAERLGKLMKEAFDTSGMYIKSKLKTANKMLESKNSDIESSNQLRESISEELTQMSEEARAEAIQENGLGYMFNEDGTLSEEYKNMDDDSKRKLSKVNDTLKKLDENIKINYFRDDDKGNQGSYSKSTNTIKINLNASDPFRVVGIHEFTHSLEGTKAYKDLYDFVLNESKNNNKYDTLYQSKRRLYTKPFNDSSFVRDLKQAFNEKKITKQEYNTAYEDKLNQYVNEEIVASFISEDIFTNEETIDRLTEEKPTVAKRIYNWIKNKLKKKDIVSKDFEKTLNKAVNLYKKAIETANIRKMQTDFNNKVKNNDVKFDYTDLQKYVSNKTERSAFIEKATDAIYKVQNKLETKKEIREKVEKYVNDMEIVGQTLEDLGLTYIPNEIDSAIKSNGEYIYTLDLSTICAKRIQLQRIWNDIAKENPESLLKIDAYITLLNTMDEFKLITPCTFCFVESRRKLLAGMTAKFLNSVNDPSSKNKIEAKQCIEEFEKSEGRKLTNEDLLDSDNLQIIKVKYPKLYSIYNRFYGATKPKLSEPPTSYMFGTITSIFLKKDGTINKELIQKVNDAGGLRMLSFSDFQVEHALDFMQMIFEASTLGLKIQAYTKVPEFAEIVKGTNVKCNLSIVYTLDENGNFVPNNVQGMDIEIAKKLRKDNPNTGTVVIGPDVLSSLKLMDSSFIDYIIPFHRSNWAKKELPKLGLQGYTDFTNYQNEKKGTLGTKKTKSNIPQNAYWSDKVSGNENSKRYIKYCVDHDIKPKFADVFLLNTERKNGKSRGKISFENILIQNDIKYEKFKYKGYEFLIPNGYWKTLGDYRNYDDSGNNAPQKPVIVSDNLNNIVQMLMSREGKKIEHKLKDGNYTSEESIDEIIKQVKERFYEKVNSNKNVNLSSIKDADEQDIRYSIKETVEPEQYKESFEEYKETISDEKVKAFLNSELMKNEDILKLTKAKISKKVTEFTGVENIKEKTEKVKNGKLIKRTTTKLAEENHKLLVDVMKTLKSYEKNYVINAINKINLKTKAVKNVKKIPKKYVIDSADLNQAMVYDKKSIEKVTSALLNKIKQDLNVALESGEQIVEYIFQEINKNKKVDEIASVIAEFIIDSAEILNKSKNSEYLKDELISEIKEELYQETLTSGREGKFHKFQRYTMDKIYDLKYKKSALSSIRKTLTNMKSYKTKSFKNAKNSKKISAILEKGMPVFEKLTEVKTEQGKDGKTKRRRYKLYNPSTRKLVLDLKSELASNKAFENEFKESLLNSVESLRTKLNSDEKLTTYELQIVDRFFQKINSIVEDYGVKFKENKENIAIKKAKNVAKKIKNKPQTRTNFAKKVTDNFLKPSDILEHIEGSVMGEKSLLNKYIIKPLEEADVKQGVLFQSYFKDFETFYKNNKKYLKQISKKEDFKGVKITKAQKISLYLLSKRHQARIHFMKEDNAKAHGIQIQDKNGNYVDTIFITQEDIDSIVNSFSETDLEYIKLVEDFFQTTAKEENKKADLEYQGYTLVNDDYYYPAPTAKDGDHYSRLGDARVFKKLDSVFGAYFNKEINPDANNALVLKDVNQVVVNHMNMLSKYVAYANTVKEIERFLNVEINDERLLKTLNKKWYNFENYLNKWILDIIAVDERSSLDKFLSKARSFLAVSQLGANVKVIVNQFSIIPTAYSVLDAKSIAKGLTMKMGKNSKALMDKYCPYVQQRNYRNEYVRSETNAVMGTLNKAQEFFMSFIGKADRQTIAMIWNACQVEVESKQGHKIGTEKNLKEAGKLLEKVVRRTQDTSTIGQPTLKRSKNALLNFLSMYQTQNLQSLSVLSRSILDLKTIKERAKTQPKNKDAIKKAQTQAYKNIARAGAGVFTSNLLYALIAVFFKRIVLDKKEDEQTFLEEFGFDVLEANAGMIPILNNVYSLIFEGFDIKITALDTVNDLVHASSDLYNSVSTGNYRGAWFRFSKALSPAVGIPFKNINEYGMSIISAFNPDLAYKYRSIWYNKSISEYSEDYANALQSNDTNTSEAILGQIYAEKGVSVSDNNIISKLNTIAKQAGLENVKKLLPKTISDTVTYNSVEYKLTNIQERNLRSTFSKDVSSNLNKLFYNTQFNDLNAQEKAQAIKSINDYTYFNALQKVLNINTQDNKLILLSGAVNVYTLASVYAKCKNTYKGNKQAVQKYINSLKLSKEQKYILYGFLGYKPIQDNAYTLVSNYLSSKGYDYSQVQEVLTVCKFVDENGLIY